MIFSSFLYCFFFPYWLAWKSNNTALIFNPASISLPVHQPCACLWWVKTTEYDQCHCGVRADMFEAFRMWCSQPLSAFLVLNECGPCRRAAPGVWPLQTGSTRSAAPADLGEMQTLWLSSDKAQPFKWFCWAFRLDNLFFRCPRSQYVVILWCPRWSNWASRSLPSLGWNSRETHLLIYPSIRGEVRAVY